MSAQPLWLRDLAAYSLQAAALVAAGILMARALRLRLPRVRLAYWQGLLILCMALPLVQPWRPEVLQFSSVPLAGIAFQPSAAAAPRGLPLAEIVLLVICAGIALRILWIALGLIRLWMYRREAQRLESLPPAIEEAGQLAGASPAIFISRRLRTPATFGFFRPVVLLPERFLQMEPPMQKAIALHELLHVRRRDWLWNMLEEAVLTALWFHLPLWWVVRSARLSREQVVDAEAVRRTRQRRPYLQALLQMAGQPSLAESLPAPLFLRESDLAQRVALMMKEVHMSRTRLTVSILAAAATLLLAGASAVWTFPLQSPARPDASAASPGADSAPPQAAKVYKPGGDVQPPQRISTPEPPYTDQARKDHITGPAVFSMTIDARGAVTAVEEKSKPLGDGLDESAARTLRTWKFRPATRRGVAVPVQVSVEVYFKLYDKKNDPAPQPRAAADPPQSESADSIRRAEQISREDALRQAEAAVKQAQAQQRAAEKINTAEIQRQVRQALEQAKKAQADASKIDEAKIREQVELAERQAKNAEQQAAKINSAELQRRLAELKVQAAADRQAAEKLNSADVQRRIEQAVKQAGLAQADAAKINQAEIRKQLDQVRRQVEAARMQADRARRDAERKLHTLQNEQRAIEANPDAAPAPPVAPAPASPDVAPSPAPAPAAPDAAPVAPVAPPSGRGIGAQPGPPPPAPDSPPRAAIRGGVPGGVIAGTVGGVPGGKIGGVSSGVVGGVPGADLRR